MTIFLGIVVCMFLKMALKTGAAEQYHEGLLSHFCELTEWWTCEIGQDTRMITFDVSVVE